VYIYIEIDEDSRKDVDLEGGRTPFQVYAAFNFPPCYRLCAHFYQERPENFYAHNFKFIFFFLFHWKTLLSLSWIAIEMSVMGFWVKRCTLSSLITLHVEFP
jgi:hypothetical protein